MTRSFAAVALVAACAGPHAAPPARAPAPTPVPLPAAIPPAHAPAAPPGVLYGPSALRYVMHQRLHLEQDYGMGVQTQNLGYRVYVSATITGPSRATSCVSRATASRNAGIQTQTIDMGRRLYRTHVR